jgi:hypothetical protein
MSDDRTVGVVIVTYNSADVVGACLGSLLGAASTPMQVVVVDNDSSDDTGDLIAEQFPQVTLIRKDQNRFYAAASNQGIQRVSGRYILLLNPDTILPVGGIDALSIFLDSHPDAAAVAPQLVYPNGRRQPSLREFPGLDTLWYDLLGLAFLFPRSRTFGRWRMGYFDGQSERAVDQPMASCLMIRREALQQVGLFDESYPMFFNDVDWCARVKNAGLTIMYTPDIKITHQGGASVAKAKIRMIWMSHRAYWLYLSRLHRGHLFKRLLVDLSWPVLVLAAILRSLYWLIVR